MNVSHNLGIRPDEKNREERTAMLARFFSEVELSLSQKWVSLFLFLTFCAKSGSYHIVSICCVVTKA